jgi:hypothetical protein
LPSKERQIRVTKPRLRNNAVRPGEAGEVEIPAHEAPDNLEAQARNAKSFN